MSDWAFATAFIGSIVLGVCVLVGGVAVGGSRIQKHYDHISCTQFGEQSNRQVRFVTYNYWSWDCLTPTADGKWISTHNLREFGSAP